MKQFISSFILLLCLILTLPSFAKTLDSEITSKNEISKKQKGKSYCQEKDLNKFIAWDKKLKTLQTDFEQETSYEGTFVNSSIGRLYKKNNNICLDTLKDGEIIQRAKSDKVIINIFDEDNKLITSMSWLDWQSSQNNKTLFDFGNYEKVLLEHKKESFNEVDGFCELVLTSKINKEGAFYTLTFLLDKNTLFPKEISLLEEGVKSKTILTNMKINQPLPKGIFND